MVLWRPTRPSRINTPQKGVLFKGLECKNQEISGVKGKFGLGVQDEAGQRLTEICQENLLFQQHKRWLYTWSSPDGQYQNKIDDILCSQRWRSSLQSAETRLGADCGSNHELLIAKFRLKLEKVGKTTRPFRYDLNQIPYNYKVEMRNRFKGLALMECLKYYGWRFMTVQEAVIKTIPKKKKCKKAKWLSEEASQITEKKRS